MARVHLWETQTGRRAQVIGTDNGEEYLGEPWSRRIAGKGSTHQATAPCTSKQNGGAERYNSVLTKRVMALLADSKLHSKSWAEVAVTVKYLAIHVPHRGCESTPYEAFHNKRLDIFHILVCRCQAWAYTPRDMRHKLQPRSKLGIFMG